MLKFLLIVILVGFLLIKVLGLFFRVLLGSSGSNNAQGRGYQNQQHQARSGRNGDGNVNIDYVPKNGNNKKSPKVFKGGEYVDYEEID